MCDKTCDINDIQTFTGYKVAIKRRDKNGKVRYYSPATGVEYKVGPVEIPKSQNNYISVYFAGNLLNPKSAPFRKELVGYTAVFVERHDAEILFYDILDGLFLTEYTNTDIVIVYMTIKEKLWKGVYRCMYAPVIAGKYISEIKEI